MSADSHPMMFRIRQASNVNLWWKDTNKPGEDTIGVSGEFAPDRHAGTLYPEPQVQKYLVCRESLPSEFILELQPQRFMDAIAINEGASNIQAVARSLVRAAREVSHERVGTAGKDPAVRLITHQLAHLAGLPVNIDLTEYRSIVEQCEQRKDSK